MYMVKDVAFANNIIETIKTTVIKGQDPESKCWEWNNILARTLRENDVPAVVFGSPHYEFKNRRSGVGMGHWITILKLDAEWMAVDLSSGQIDGLDAEKDWHAGSLEGLCAEVGQSLPRFMHYTVELESEFTRSAERVFERERELRPRRG